MTILKLHPLLLGAQAARLKTIPHPFEKGMKIPSDIVRRATRPWKPEEVNDTEFVKWAEKPDLETYHDGAVGLWAQEQMEKIGWEINTNGGANIPMCCVELQTRRKSAHSHVSFGSMTAADIVKTLWEKSTFRDKLQYQLRLYWDAHNETICEVELYDFTLTEIQEKLKFAYEELRQQVMECFDEHGKLQHNLPDEIKTTYWIGEERAIIFERSSASYKMRINPKFLKRLEALSLQLPVQKAMLVTS